RDELVEERLAASRKFGQRDVEKVRPPVRMKQSSGASAPRVYRSMGGTEQHEERRSPRGAQDKGGRAASGPLEEDERRDTAQREDGGDREQEAEYAGEREGKKMLEAPIARA